MTFSMKNATVLLVLAQVSTLVNITMTRLSIVNKPTISLKLHSIKHVFGLMKVQLIFLEQLVIMESRGSTPKQ